MGTRCIATEHLISQSTLCFCVCTRMTAAVSHCQRPHRHGHALCSRCSVVRVRRAGSDRGPSPHARPLSAQCISPAWLGKTASGQPRHSRRRCLIMLRLAGAPTAQGSGQGEGVCVQHGYPPPPLQGTRTAKHCPSDTHNQGTELAMKVVRQARLELSGGSTPDLLRPHSFPRSPPGPPPPFQCPGSQNSSRLPPGSSRHPPGTPPVCSRLLPASDCSAAAGTPCAFKHRAAAAETCHFPTLCRPQTPPPPRLHSAHPCSTPTAQPRPLGSAGRTCIPMGQGGGGLWGTCIRGPQGEGGDGGPALPSCPQCIGSSGVGSARVRTAAGLCEGAGGLLRGTRPPFLCWKKGTSGL